MYAGTLRRSSHFSDEPETNDPRLLEKRNNTNVSPYWDVADFRHYAAILFLLLLKTSWYGTAFLRPTGNGWTMIRMPTMP